MQPSPLKASSKFPEVQPASAPTRRLKVARIFGRLSLGGATRQVCHLHGAMRDQFNTVLITGPLEEGEADMSGLLNTTDGVYQVESMRRKVGLWQDLRSLLLIAQILRKERPDIVHTHCSKAGALGRVAAALVGVPVRVHTYHGHVFRGHFGALKSAVYLWIERFLNRIGTAAIAISETQARELGEVYRVAPPQKITAVRTGFDLERFACCHDDSIRSDFHVPDDAVLIVWAGRFAEVKNLALLAEVIRTSAAELPKAHFLLVGDGPDRDLMRESIAGLANVTMTGMVPDMRRVWTAADIALLTSRSEGTPATMIEAMAAATPFVSTEVGGVVDITAEPRLRDPETAVLWTGNALLTPANAVLIVDALRVLVDNPELRRCMGSIGQQFAFAHHTSERLVTELEDLYWHLFRLQSPISEQELIVTHECGR